MASDLNDAVRELVKNRLTVLNSNIEATAKRNAALLQTLEDEERHLADMQIARKQLQEFLDA